MAHYQQLKFVENCIQNLDLSQPLIKVLEVGSWDVNGSIRNLIAAREYVGIDIAPGPGVDYVVPGQEAGFTSNYFDLVISCECFEHNRFWKETFANMIRMLRPGGTCIITCASTVRGEHGTPRSANNFSLTSLTAGDHYYHNLDKSDFINSGLIKNFQSHIFLNNIYSRDTYFIGVKLGPVANPDYMKIVNSMKEITTAQPINFPAKFFANINYYLRYFIAKMLGEKKYHDVVFTIKKFLNRK